MKKQYLTPATQAQSLTMCQLMTGSYTPTINVGDPIEGSKDNPIMG